MRKGSKTKLAKKSLTKKKKATLQKAGALKRQVQRESQSLDTVAFALEGQGARPGGQLGDLQGYPMSKVRIQRVWTTCSKKETRSRLSW